MATLEDLTARIDAGERLSDQDAAALASSRDIITLGMLATTIRRRLHGNEVTYVRVFDLQIDDKADLKVGTTSGGPTLAAGEVRIFQRRRRSMPPLPSSNRRATLPAATPLSAFCLFELGKLPEGLPVVLPALKKAGLDAVTQAPIDRLTDPERALESLADAGLPLARMTVNDTPDAQWISVCREVAASANAAPDDTRVRSTGANYRRCTANYGLRRCQAYCPRAAGRRQRRHDSGRLGPVRSEACAGGADVRRRRHRLGRRSR